MPLQRPVVLPDMDIESAAVGVPKPRSGGPQRSAGQRRRECRGARASPYKRPPRNVLTPSESLGAAFGGISLAGPATRSAKAAVEADQQPISARTRSRLHRSFGKSGLTFVESKLRNAALAKKRHGDVTRRTARYLGHPVELVQQVAATLDGGRPGPAARPRPSTAHSHSSAHGLLRPRTAGSADTGTSSLGVSLPLKPAGALRDGALSKTGMRAATAIGSFASVRAAAAAGLVPAPTLVPPGGAQIWQSAPLGASDSRLDVGGHPMRPSGLPRAGGPAPRTGRLVGGRGAAAAASASTAAAAADEAGDGDDDDDVAATAAAAVDATAAAAASFAAAAAVAPSATVVSGLGRATAAASGKRQPPPQELQEPTGALKQPRGGRVGGLIKSTCAPSELPVGFALVRVVGGGSAASPTVLAKRGAGKGAAHVRIKSTFFESATADECRAARAEQAALRAVQASGGHTHVVALLEELDDPARGCLHLVLEPCLGGTLRDRIGELSVERGVGNGMPEAEAYELTCQLAAALDALHGVGVFHRALAPEALCYSDGTRQVLKLTSFGCAELAPASARSSGRSGSADSSGGAAEAMPPATPPTLSQPPQYRAPECWGDAAFLGGPADVWSAGAIVYECLHGRPAFDADTLPKLALQIKRAAAKPLRADLSAAASSLLNALLIREPFMRVGPRQLAHVYMPRWKRELGD